MRLKCLPVKIMQEKTVKSFLPITLTCSNLCTIVLEVEDSSQKFPVEEGIHTCTCIYDNAPVNKKINKKYK